jgi:hypothetical protein
MALLGEIADYLDAQSLTGGATGWTAKTGRFSEESDQQVLVRATPGQTPEAWTDLEYPGFQIVTRGPVDDVVTAEAQADRVFGALHRVTPGTALGGKVYAGLTALQSPYVMEWDTQNRPIVVQNFRALRSGDRHAFGAGFGLGFS